MDQALTGSGMVSTLQKFRQLHACTLLQLSSTLVYHKNLSIRKEKKNILEEILQHVKVSNFDVPSLYLFSPSLVF